MAEMLRLENVSRRFKEGEGQLVLHLPLDHPPQRAGAEVGVVPLVREPLLGVGRDDEGEPPLGQPGAQPGELNADDDRTGTAQTYHVGDVAQCPRRERIHHVQRGNVDDHAVRAEVNHLVDQRTA